MWNILYRHKEMKTDSNMATEIVPDGVLNHDDVAIVVRTLTWFNPSKRLGGFGRKRNHRYEYGKATGQQEAGGPPAAGKLGPGRSCAGLRTETHRAGKEPRSRVC
jgi:hypothetical protein